MKGYHHQEKVSVHGMLGMLKDSSGLVGFCFLSNKHTLYNECQKDIKKKLASQEK